MLLRQFPKDEGFLVFRSERAGDEFKITSFRRDISELEEKIQSVWSNDLHRGLLGWNYGVGRNDAEAHVNLYKNRLDEMESMGTSDLNGKSTFVIVRPESEDYPGLYKLSEETAHVAGGSPIIDLHLTVQAIRNVEDFEALRARLEEYSRKLRPFEIRVKNIARMNINNQRGRLWLLAEKSKTLENIYDDLSRIACEMGYESYPYKSQDWLPHIKIVDLPEDGSTRIKDPTFGTRSEVTFKVTRLEWTVQKAPEHWELLDQFPFAE
jgi:2'-5' RNA ligase